MGFFFFSLPGGAFLALAIDVFVSFTGGPTFFSLPGGAFLAFPSFQRFDSIGSI